jgi:hypothetical protein
MAFRLMVPPIMGASASYFTVGAFFAASRLQSQLFVGTAYWLGFTTSLLAAGVGGYTSVRQAPC